MAYLRKPAWLKVEKGASHCGSVNRTLERHGLNSVCQEAACPNQGECFKKGTATFMLLGKHCTRNCTFCKVGKALPEPLNHNEPTDIAKAVGEMGLRHVVLTSVTRDDLLDGGADHFAKTILAIRKHHASSTIEVLIPDFKGNLQALQTVLKAEPDVLNHNVETIPELYSEVRPMANFTQSLELLRRVKSENTLSGKRIYTKSGFMVGLGETESQVFWLLQQLHETSIDIVTIGQYLQPSKEHYEIREYIHPDQFEKYKQKAYELGIPCVAAGPLVRSSYHAEDDLKKLQERI